jgi:hypothetical protein
MKSGIKKFVISLIGLIPFAVTKASLAESQRADCPLTPEVSNSVCVTEIDSQTLEDYQNLIRNNYGLSSDIITINYHYESQTVDLSTFDGHIITIPINEMRVASPNGEGGNN